MPDTENLPQSGGRAPLDGLARLAFGPVNDALRLFAGIGEIDESVISSLNLFCVSEIKQTKDGCLEIKFYDRIKALELLTRCGGQDANPAANSFYAALESAAKSACDADAV